mgnify:CR=1 FL=1
MGSPEPVDPLQNRETAATPVEREHGLMQRTQLCAIAQVNYWRQDQGCQHHPVCGNHQGRSVSLGVADEN